MGVVLIAFYIQVAVLATAGRTHLLLLFYFETLDLHAVIGIDAQIRAMAMRAAAYQRRE
ncbi:hypothetical protein CSE899_02990 [Cronobacter sakazakii E899]|nr:hypothetical protein CSE899_02990 [Cronobacter sakazakii E899]